ncbi:MULTISPECIES: RNA polymerase sigma factor [Rheinheimera]|uniref:RNA polymerase sigma factor n=1 Tax=Rheinheimera marina TaxID=1774958 RepID=A0ABV9JPS7_9GAMM
MQTKQQQPLELLQDIAPRLKRALQFWVRNKDDRADIYQETLTTMLERPEPERISNSLAYALTVAKHLVFRHSQPQLQSLQPEDDLVDPNTDLEQQLLAQEQQRLLQQALASLPPLRRDVLIRRRLKQQSREQIARELGISEEAVKKHISRALAQLASLHPSER